MIDRQIKLEIDSLKTLHTIVETYEEIAAMRMRKIKNSVLINRNFIVELKNVYKDVEKSPKLLSTRDKLTKQIKNIGKIFHDKRVSVLLSANTGLYGSVVRDTIQAFIKEIKNEDTDIIIIGKVGMTLYEKEPNKRPYKYFEFSDEGVDEVKVVSLLNEIIQYKEVVVHYGLFKDILTQQPQRSSLVSGSLLSPSNQLELPIKNSEIIKNSTAYILEPTAEELVDFFESEVLRLIFVQYLYESNLSKFASRMINLDYAIVNISSKLKKTNFQRLKQKHRKNNSKQQDVLSGISLWRI